MAKKKTAPPMTIDEAIEFFGEGVDEALNDGSLVYEPQVQTLNGVVAIASFIEDDGRVSLAVMEEDDFVSWMKAARRDRRRGLSTWDAIEENVNR